MKALIIEMAKNPKPAKYGRQDQRSAVSAAFIHGLQIGKAVKDIGDQQSPRK